MVFRKKKVEEDEEMLPAMLQPGESGLAGMGGVLGEVRKSTAELEEEIADIKARLPPAQESPRTRTQDITFDQAVEVLAEIINKDQNPANTYYAILFELARKIR